MPPCPKNLAVAATVNLLPQYSTHHHFKGYHVNFILWIIIGGLIGWVASKIMNTDAQQGIILNIVVGIVGAFLAGLFISPLLGIPNINSGSLSVGSLLVSLVGAVILLAIVNLIRKGSAR